MEGESRALSSVAKASEAIWNAAPGPPPATDRSCATTINLL